MVCPINKNSKNQKISPCDSEIKPFKKVKEETASAAFLTSRRRGNILEIMRNSLEAYLCEFC